MLYQIFIIAIITAIKAVFSAADSAFTYLNKAEINQLSKKNKKAKKVKILMEDSRRFFGVIEVGTNLAELIASSYASVTILNFITVDFIKIGLEYEVAIFVSAIILTLVLAYILLIFGGVLPKMYARSHPRKVAFTLVNIVWIMTYINHPFEKFVNWSVKLFAKILGITDQRQEKLTETQIKMIITEGREEGVIASIEKRILFNALKLDNIPVSRTMIPTEKVNFIDINQSFEEVLKNIDTYRFTRMPVYEDNIENIIGILNIKDIVLEYAKNKEINGELRHFLRKVKFISPHEKILNAFKEMQKENQMIAVVKNKNDKVVGIISMEDILEKIVGKISDEYGK